MTIIPVVEGQLARAATWNPQLAAIISLDPDGALSTARRLDEEEPSGLLHGLTLAVKDNIDVAGTATTAGASFRRDRLANDDAPVVARLRRAGAVIVGKANLAELAFGIRSRSSVGGQCRNPWDPARIPGGSSGGSGAAVAAGFCTAALGTDTGGSVRLPAAYCGISGLRPTWGRVPNRGSVPVCAAQDTIGPMAHRVSDVARLFAVMAGFDADDPCSVEHPLENFLPTLTDGVAGLRIGLPRNYYFEGCDEEVVQAVMAAAHVLERQGATLVQIDVPRAEEVHAMTSAIVFADACAIYGNRIQTAPETMDPDVVARMRTGLALTALDYARAVAFRREWGHTMHGLFQQVDLLLSPTAPSGAPPIEDGQSLLEATRSATKNTYGGAFAELPSLSMPCGLTRDGLPIGVHLEAARWQEPLLLRVGCTYQRHTDFHLAAPKLG